MLGKKASSLHEQPWYLLARDGDLVLRVRPGMRLGEDAAGELSFDRSDAHFTLDIGDDGGLALVADPDFALELDSGERTHTVEVGRRQRAHVSLPASSLSLDTDFAGAGSRETLQIRTVCEVVTEQRPDVDPDGGSALQPRPPRRSGAHNTEPRATSASATPPATASETVPASQPEASERATLVPEAMLAALAEAAEGAEAAQPGGVAEERAERTAAEAPRPVFPQVQRRTWLALSFAAIAIGSTLALTLMYPVYRPQLDALFGWDDVVPGAAQRIPAPRVLEPNAAEALASITALLESDAAVSESTLSVALQSLKALMAAYPDDLRLLRSLEQLTERLAREATAQHDLGHPDLAKRLIDQAATTGVAQEHVARALAHVAAAEAAARAAGRSVTPAAAADGPPVPAPVAGDAPAPGATAPATASVPSPAAEPSLSAAEPSAPAEPLIAAAEPAASTATLVEPVTVPPMPRRALPEPSAPPAAVGETSAVAAPNSAALVAELERIGVEVQRVAARYTNARDLRAADAALARGDLLRPAAASAFGLYSRVLDAEPDSEPAARGLQAVRAGLLTRAEASLAAGEPAAITLAKVADAARAGADPDAVARLRTGAEFRQRLLDARAGRFDSLYPFAQLTAVRQDPPRYPRYAPDGAAGSVDLEMTIDEGGDVRDVVVLGEPPLYFARAAKRAVSRWQFEPVRENGQPMPVRTSVRLTFRN